MKLNILMFYNTIIECYTQPVFDDHNPDDAAIQLGRSLRVEKDLNKVIPYKNLKLYFIGEFDDATGKITLNDQKRLLLDCRKIVEERDDYVPSQEVEPRV